MTPHQPAGELRSPTTTPFFEQHKPGFNRSQLCTTTDRHPSPTALNGTPSAIHPNRAASPSVRPVWALVCPSRSPRALLLRLASTNPNCQTLKESPITARSVARIIAPPSSHHRRTFHTLTINGWMDSDMTLLLDSHSLSWTVWICNHVPSLRQLRK